MIPCREVRTKLHFQIATIFSTLVTTSFLAMSVAQWVLWNDNKIVFGFTERLSRSRDHSFYGCDPAKTARRNQLHKYSRWRRRIVSWPIRFHPLCSASFAKIDRPIWQSESESAFFNWSHEFTPDYDYSDLEWVCANVWRKIHSVPGDRYFCFLFFRQTFDRIDATKKIYADFVVTISTLPTDRGRASVVLQRTADDFYTKNVNIVYRPPDEERAFFSTY